MTSSPPRPNEAKVQSFASCSTDDFAELSGKVSLWAASSLADAQNNLIGAEDWAWALALAVELFAMGMLPPHANEAFEDSFQSSPEADGRVCFSWLYHLEMTLFR